MRRLLPALALAACSPAPAKEPADPRPSARADLARGERLYRELSCGGCHDGGGAPTLAGRAGEVELEGGARVAWDAAYVRESLVAPGAKVPKGQPADMPSYRDRLSEEDLRDLVAYVLGR